MKNKGNGQAKILNADELERLFDEGFTSNRLGTLQRYLEVSAEQKRKAVSVIGW